MTAGADLAYRDRVEAAVLRAIVETSLLDGDGRHAVLLAGEILDALVSIAAGIAAQSGACSTARDQRELVDGIARLLRRRIASHREHAAIHGAPFRSVEIEGALQ